VNFDVPKGVTITVPKQTEIVVEGIDQQQVGQVAANIREWRAPEPYKGKGIRYKDEYHLPQGRQEEVRQSQRHGGAQPRET
jgi:large subunit ribosomal protein L6